MFNIFMEYLAYPVSAILSITIVAIIYYKGQYDLNTDLVTRAKFNQTYKIQSPNSLTEYSGVYKKI